MIKLYFNKNVGFVLVQLILFIVYFFRISSLDFPIANGVRYFGGILSLLGLFLIVAAFLALKHNLTPFPAPKKNVVLVTSGIYKYSRHPIYAGIIYAAIGFGLYSENSLRLLVSQFLVLLFYRKGRYEEKLLMEKFPGYKEYRAKTFSIFPFVN